MALPIFALTLFVSAFLLFIVQPMIGKMILPVLGGTPQVWNTCCVFFQSVLLLGYFYTHATTTYLKPRMQMLLHGALLLVPLTMLIVMGPFSAKGFDPPTGVNPIWSTLFFLGMIVGVPFFVVSTSAPLLQRWFSFSGDPTADDPYFLYGASNLGSLLSLLAYPFFVEPHLYLPQQAISWTVGYACLVGLCALSAFLVWNRMPATAEAAAAATSDAAAANVAPEPMPALAPPETKTAIQSSRLVGKRKGLKSAPAAAQTTTKTPPRSVARADAYDPVAAPITWLRCVRWIFLAAIPSSLMLGVTTYVSTDLSPFPLLWIIPLSLYLLSFILVFSKWPLPWTGLPHTIFLYMMPMFLIGLCMVLFTQSYSPIWPTRFQFLCFFIITMALHGELAKDRPATRHLTLFFLCMSVGGVLGGIFNAIFAPIVFTTVIEYPLAIFFACLLRPNMVSTGWIDGLILENPNVRDSATESSDAFAKSFGQNPTHEPFLLSYAVDVGIGLCIALLVWVCVTYSNTFAQGFINALLFVGIPESVLANSQQMLYIVGIYGLGMLASLIVMPRSLRFAIGIGALLFMFHYSHERTGQIYADRSYFGVLRVLKDTESLRDRAGEPWDEATRPNMKDIPGPVPYNYLMHGSTYHGRSYQIPELSRLATTYYHRFGPVGAITEKYNWLPGPQSTYYADFRLPISMIGLGATPGMPLPLPMGQLVDAWSEPPYATVGLGTGTMASYGRWLQHVTYYEIDEKIRNMNLPPNKNKEPFFLTVRDALDRQANVEIIMGDARQSLFKEDKRYEAWLKNPDIVGRGPTPMRENYYKFLNLDAFSSDAIPVHLITKEAIALYMSKLAPDGVLMVHTSNRHMKLPEPVADICKELGLDAITGKDNGGDEGTKRNWPQIARRYKLPTKRIWSLGHYGSEYVMVANKKYTTTDANGKQIEKPVISVDILKNAVKPEKRDGVDYATSVVRWKAARVPGREVWSDHYQDIVSIMRGLGNDEDEDD